MLNTNDVTFEIVPNYTSARKAERWLLKDGGFVVGDILNTGHGSWLAMYGGNQWLFGTAEEAAMALLEHHTSLLQVPEITLTKADIAA